MTNDCVCIIIQPVPVAERVVFMKRKHSEKLKKRFKCYCVSLAVLLFLAAGDTAILVAEYLCENEAHTLPSYARDDVTELLLKETRTAQDYEQLYRQTGLTQAGIARLETTYQTKNNFVAQTLAFQDALFSQCEIGHERVSPVTSRDIITSRNGGASSVYTPLVPLENGDVLVTSVCHTFGWRHGHAALVVDAPAKTVLESVTVGENSMLTIDGASWFQANANFMLLRLKDEYRTKIDPAKVASEAVKNLNDIPYSLTVGIFSKKDLGTHPRATHCGHLVWQAYKNFGLDVDGNGGPVVTAKDIARSEYFEPVQVFGFDLDALWR